MSIAQSTTNKRPCFGMTLVAGSDDPQSARVLGLSPEHAGFFVDTGSKTMDMRRFSKINRDRCESPNGFGHALDSWSTSDWMTAVVGELGEAANIVKKLNRERDGVPGNEETPSELRKKLARELADTFIYLDLLAQSVGFELSDIVPVVFNAKSVGIGSSIVIVDD